MHHRREPRSLELDCVCDQVLKKLLELTRVRAHLRQIATRDSGRGVLDCRAEVRYYLVDYLIGVDQFQLQCTRSNPRIRQQVVDELLHTTGTVDGKTDELVRIWAEFLAVATSQQLGIRRNHAQW